MKLWTGKKEVTFRNTMGEGYVVEELLVNGEFYWEGSYTTGTGDVERHLDVMAEVLGQLSNYHYTCGYCGKALSRNCQHFGHIKKRKVL